MVCWISIGSAFRLQCTWKILSWIICHGFHKLQCVRSHWHICCLKYQAHTRWHLHEWSMCMTFEFPWGVQKILRNFSFLCLVVWTDYILDMYRHASLPCTPSPPVHRGINITSSPLYRQKKKKRGRNACYAVLEHWVWLYWLFFADTRIINLVFRVAFVALLWKLS